MGRVVEYPKGGVAGVPRGYRVKPSGTGAWVVTSYILSTERPVRGRHGVGVTEREAHKFAALMAGTPVGR